MFGFLINCIEKAVDRFEEDVSDVLDGSAFNPLKTIEKTIDRAQEDLEDFFD